MSLSEISLIGCRISIISKAKIRYEGYLHSVDCDTPNEPVITLSKVWSFGTEDRPCERPVAPRNEEYNQVVFRGRDLEDVRLVQSSVFLNEDSAIVSAAPGSSSANVSTPKKTDPVNGAQRAPDSGSNVASSVSDAQPNVSFQSLSLDGLSQSNSRPGASAFHLPSTGSRLGPIGTLKSDLLQPSDTRGPRPFGDGRSDGDTGVFSGSKIFDHFGGIGASQPEPNRQRMVVGSSPRFDSAQVWGNRTSQPRGGSAFFRGPPPTYTPDTVEPSDNYQRRRPGFTNQWSGYQRGPRFPQSGYIRRGNRPAGHFGWLRPTSVPQTEYDYETANAELAVELEKISVSNPKPGSVDGDASKTEDSSSSATGEDAICYNQGKSFFDTLSSEMMDKANGVTQHGFNRRDEQLLNSTTFGVPPSHFHRRGGYHSSRPGSGYGNYSYGQRRTGGGFWRSTGNGGHRNNMNAIPPLSSTNSVN